MIVCPYEPSVLMDDLYEAFYCSGCPDCRLLESLRPNFNLIYLDRTQEDEEK